MIILITGIFPIYDQQGVKIREEFVASHGYDIDTLQTVIVQSIHPSELGAKYSSLYNAWVIDED